MSSQDKIQRSILPIPDAQHVGLTTYDAKDPDTKFPPIEPLRPPKGAPNVLIVLIDDCGFGASSAFGGPDPHAERRAAGEERAEAQPLSHDRALLADAPGAAHRAQSPFGEHGRHLRDRDLGARLHLGAAEEQGAARHDAQAQWLLDRAVRQVPRGAGLADEPDGAVRPVAHRRRRIRVLLRLHRRRDQPVVSGHLRRHDADGTEQESGGGLPLHRGHDEQGDRVGAPAEGADARQAVLHVFRARRHPRPASRAEGVDRQVQGQVRRRLGQAARRDLCPPEEAGRDSGRCGADQAARRDPRLRRHAGGAQADSRPRDGGLCRRSSSIPTTTSAACSTR